MPQSHLLNVKGVHAPKTHLGLTKFQLLLEAAEKLFTKASFYEVSVSDICKEAHTAVGTFYIYFDSKTDLYRYLVAQYKVHIRKLLAEAIQGLDNRLDMEREGIKAFVRFSVRNPNVYNIIWGSLAVEKQMFVDYYVSFASSYARALNETAEDLTVKDTTTVAYMLMGITNFLGLRAQFETMDDLQIEEMIDDAIVPILERGLFKS